MFIQYIPRNMHTVFSLLCFVVVIHWLIFPYPSGLLHWHCGNLMIAPVPAKQPWWIWINTSCEFIMNNCVTTTKQSTTKPCAYFLGYTVCSVCIHLECWIITMTTHAACYQKFAIWPGVLVIANLCYHGNYYLLTNCCILTTTANSKTFILLTHACGLRCKDTLPHGDNYSTINDAEL